MSNNNSKGEVLPALVLVGALAFSGGLWRSGSQPECQSEANVFGKALCGLEVGGDEPVEAATDSTLESVPATISAPISNEVLLAEPQTVNTSPPSANDDPFDISWYTDPASGQSLMIIDGEYPVNFQHDPQWHWPLVSPDVEKYGSGCMCHPSVIATAREYLTGQFTSPVDSFQAIFDAGGLQDDKCGAERTDRVLAAQLYGLDAVELGSIYEAEEYARNNGENTFVIVGQDNRNGDAPSPYGDHVFGLVLDEEHNAWRLFDPNDYYKTPKMITREPELEDILRFWTSDMINPGVYHIVALSNPNGRQPGAWETVS